MRDTGIRTGTYDGIAVVLRCDDILARFWTMRVYDERGHKDPSTSIEPMELFIGSDTTEVKLPALAVQALAAAFDDPEQRYQARCRDLEAELARAHAIINALSSAVAPRQ